MAYKNGDVVNANDINKAIDDSATAVNTANTAKTASDKASADVVDLAQQIGTKQGTTVTVGGVAQNAIAFTSDPQTQLDNLAPKESPTLNNATLAGNTTIGNISNAEINALDGVQGNIQGQINNKPDFIVTLGGGATTEVTVTNTSAIYFSGINQSGGATVFVGTNGGEMFRTSAQQYTIYRRYGEFFIYDFNNGTTTYRLIKNDNTLGKIRLVVNYGVLCVLYN